MGANLLRYKHINVCITLDVLCYCAQIAVASSSFYKFDTNQKTTVKGFLWLLNVLNQEQNFFFLWLLYV